MPENASFRVVIAYDEFILGCDLNAKVIAHERLQVVGEYVYLSVINVEIAGVVDGRQPLLF